MQKHLKVLANNIVNHLEKISFDSEMMNYL